MKTKKNQSKKSIIKQQKKKIVVASLAVGAAGILGFFGWQYLKKRRAGKKTDDMAALLKAVNTTSNVAASNVTARPSGITTPKPSVNSSYSTSANTSFTTGFPLKKGSRGNNVRLLQEALIAKYGKSILPKYGADGDFGTETINALKTAELPTTIDESTFNVLTQSTKLDADALGKSLYNATIAKDFTKVLSLLKKMMTTEEYSAANEVFKQNRINGVRQTIVNALLSVFKGESQKQQIKFEFLRIGMQFDGSKWTLSGFDGKSIVTTETTTVWVNATDGVQVPARMVLGNEVTRRLDYTLFENNGKYFLVNSRSVQYLN